MSNDIVLEIVYVDKAPCNLPNMEDVHVLVKAIYAVMHSRIARNERVKIKICRERVYNFKKEGK